MRKKAFAPRGAAGLLRAGGGLVAVAAVALALVGSASSAQFGVSVLKDCHTPINVGDPYACEFELLNTVQDSHNTVTVKQLTDVVFRSGGTSTAVIPINNTTGGLILTGGASCDATKCTIPFGGSLTTSFISHYTAQAADFPSLSDQGTFLWNNSCDVVSAGCSTADNVGSASASADINPVQTTTTTDIHNAAHQIVTTVAAGTTVHDLVTVASPPNQPFATGNVNIDWFLNGDCSGAPAQNSGSIGPLNASGQFDATGFAFTVTAGQRAFRAHYEGQGAYLPSNGPCEPLRVVDANIQITPATADNPVGTTHVLTITVNAINGTLAAGTATASIVSGPGSFVGSPSCSYAGGGTTASCTVTITSLMSGTTVVSATSNISVSGVSITRTTNTADNTAAGGSGNAQKNWNSLGSGRVTGGGSIFATVNGVPNVRVTHGFELRCDPTDPRQSLEINWDGGNNFHLDKLINSVVCFDDPTTQPPPPPGTVIDTYAGNTLFNGKTGYHGFGYAVGTGTCNKAPATIYFILIDAGEPGTEDTAEYHIVSSGCTLDAGPAQLLKGNHQFHKS